MSDSKKYYCFCSSNCKYETMTKEQILAAIAQAVKTGSVGNVDTGFVTKIKEANGGYVTFWVGTQAQYNAIATKETNCMYIITDDTQGADIAKALETATTAANEAAVAVGKAKSIDISALVTLSEVSRPSGVTAIQFWRKKYVYSPAAGAVFFELSIAYKGTLKTTDSLCFKHSGYSAENQIGMPALCRRSQYYAEYYGDELTITPRQEYTYDDTWGEVAISGWYFCNGEG